MLEPSCTNEYLYFQKCQQHLLWETLEERLIRKLLQIYWGNNEELSQRSDKEFSRRTGIRTIYAVKSTRIGLGRMIQGKPDGCVNQGCSLGSGMVQYFIHQDRTTGQEQIWIGREWLNQFGTCWIWDPCDRLYGNTWQSRKQVQRKIQYKRLRGNSRFGNHLWPTYQ